MSGSVTAPKVKIQGVAEVILPSDPRHSKHPKHDEWVREQKRLAEKKEAPHDVHGQ
jgi:hypothetical protein